jgi:hypothetical protein
MSVRYRPQVQFLLGLAAVLLPMSPAWSACSQQPLRAQEATSASIATFIKQKHLRVLTFAGYSGSGYEDPDAMRRHATRILAASSPDSVIVNIGATAEGIGEVYELAKSQGFQTMGIVSTLARDQKVPLSKCVDFVFFVKDTTWGGLDPKSGKLSPTSSAIVANSSSIVAIGGGDIARDELMAAQRRGKAVTFIPADMHHQAARDKAAKRNEPVPTSFRGSAHAAFVTRP